MGKGKSKHKKGCVRESESDHRKSYEIDHFSSLEIYTPKKWPKLNGKFTLLALFTQQERQKGEINYFLKFDENKIVAKVCYFSIGLGAQFLHSE